MINLVPATMKLNYGLEKVRFVNPVPTGSHLCPTADLLAVERTKAGVQIKQKVVVELEGSQRPACVAETLGMFVLGEA